MSSPATALDTILSGALSRRAQGFLCVLPQGYRLYGLADARLQAAYGTAQHPDIRRLQPGGKGEVIPVDAVRDVQPFLAAAPGGAAVKTLVVFEADKLTASAANALLKPLEEPTRYTRILLLTDAPALLPATILSRCARLAVSADPGAARTEMGAHIDIDAHDAHAVTAALQLCDGDPALAAAALTHGLVTWTENLRTWLAGTDPTPPLPTLSGKNPAPLAAVGVTLQCLLLHAIRPQPGNASKREPVIAGWDQDGALAAAAIALRELGDIRRAGIDARTRLHTLLLRLRDAR